MPIIEEIIEDIPAAAPTEVPEPTPRAATPEAPDANNESGDFVFVSRGASPAEGQRAGSDASSDGPGADSYVDASETILDEALLEQAIALKDEGNAHYGEGRHEEALAAYAAALKVCPDPQRDVREAAEAQRRRARDAAVAKTRDTAAEGGDEAPQDEQEDGGDEVAIEYVPDACSKARAVLHSNSAAVHVRTEQWADCIAECAEALRYDPAHIKSHVRLCVAKEKLDDPVGLAEALRALDAAGGYGNPSELRRRLAAADRAAEAHREREAAEMLDKLKGLGNTILGKFGMSLDNFVSEKRGDGTFNIQFKQ